ncbi:MAG TPA: hypothetical protein VMK12_31350, partial [Anaeromyxobacteraceae bacterium]|nr:hypothetical protein [Anaeromyxobacteraceae bacterium]
MSFDDDIDDRRRQIATFRHAVIGELEFEGLARGDLSARVAELATRTWQTPSGRERRFSARTLWSWWSAYKHAGLSGLLPESRKIGPTQVTPDVLAAAIKARGEIP